MLNYRIPREVLLKKAPLSPCTVAHNHEDCPAGEDRRGRLYITLKDDGTILGYCHNCGGKGAVLRKGVTNIHEYINANVTDTYRVIDGGSVTQTELEFLRSSHLPGYRTETRSLSYILDKENEITYPAVQAHSVYVGWFERWGIPVKAAARDGWMFFNEYPIDKLDEPSTHRYGIIFPCVNIRGEIVNGLQYKYYNNDPMKCRTHGKMSPHLYNPYDSPLLVIVEDRMSAIKVAETIRCATLCMHGAGVISAILAHELCMMFERFFVWYDYDNTSVEKAQAMSLNALRMFTDEVKEFIPQYKYIDDKYDPKHFNEDGIREYTAWLTSRS